MKSAVSIAASLVCLFLAPQTRAADLAKAKELMWLSNMHEFVAGTIKMGMRRKQQQVGLTDAQLACVNAISPARFTDVVASAIASQLSDADVAAASEFYRSPAGQKMVNFVAAKMKGEEVANPYSAGDVEIIEKFMATPAGQKFSEVGSSDLVTQKMSDVAGDAIENCGKPKSQ